MKASVTFQASKLPLSLANIPVVQKKEGNKAINFKNREDIIAYVESKGALQDSDVYIAINCQCGKSYTYGSSDDIPETNLTCECGRKIIEYSP